MGFYYWVWPVATTPLTELHSHKGHHDENILQTLGNPKSFATMPNGVPSSSTIAPVSPVLTIPSFPVDPSNLPTGAKRVPHAQGNDTSRGPKHSRFSNPYPTGSRDRLNCRNLAVYGRFTTGRSGSFSR